MDTVYWIWRWIVQPVVRLGTNIFAAAVWTSIGVGLIALFAGRGILNGASVGFASGLAFTLTPTGLAVAILFAITGGIHAWRMAAAETYGGFGGAIAWLLDNSWSLPNSIVGSVWAMLTAGIAISNESQDSGSLYLQNGVFSGYDTTLGNVIAGVAVPRHEFVHVIQARIFGPFFYPIFIANYVINIVPYWWLFKILFNTYPDAPITNFGQYFTRGVYPFTIFELIAYGVQGSPQLRPARAT